MRDQIKGGENNIGANRQGVAGPGFVVVFPFDGFNRLFLHYLGLHGSGSPLGFGCRGRSADFARPEDLARRFFGREIPSRLAFAHSGADGQEWTVVFALAGDNGMPGGARGRWFTVERLRGALATAGGDFSPEVAELIQAMGHHLVMASRLAYGENDYIFRFRTEQQRNAGVYRLDEASKGLYQSRLCGAIKSLKRINERSSSPPALLDFGPVRYLLPSHFGFCLGVRNAIERAYETLAENPGRTVYMLSELIHNPFVNGDLKARGLRCLQTDKGEPLRDPESGQLFWDLLREGDVVVIPAFGATDSDKRRLMEKGIAVNRHDATCMLVEKVWKAARQYSEKGYTVIIHGKAEHEETKATFSNAGRHGPSLIIRNLDEARLLGRVVLEEDPRRKRELFSPLAGRHTPGFDPERDLERVAVVNQTTLLRNETLAIIHWLEEVYREKHGGQSLEKHIHPASKGDTLCYATQVNQDALEKSLALPVDAAIVAGGVNSSNTFQLFRICRERLGERAFYIQSERNLLSLRRVSHYRFPEPAKSGQPLPVDQGGWEEVDFLPPSDQPLTLLLTGGASCPDGIIQQIITRINGFFPAQSLRSVEEVLEKLNNPFFPEFQVGGSA